MEIIKHGSTYKIITCSYCGAEIGYSATDIETYGEISGKGFYYCITCPECGGRILFKEE